MTNKVALKVLEQQISSFEPGMHLGCIFHNEEEFLLILTSYIRLGLERGEKVLCLMEAFKTATLWRSLTQHGLAVEPHLERGQLEILTPEASYVRGRVFDPEAMIALWQEATNRALEKGYGALRICGDMSWALMGMAGSERIFEYEAKLNTFVPDSKSLAMCLYDQRKFSSDDLLNVLSTHPLAIIGLEVFDNFYYLPPESFLGPDSAEARLNNWVASLARKKSTEASLRESEEKYRHIFESAPVGIFKSTPEGKFIEVNPALAEIFGYDSSQELITSVNKASIAEVLYVDPGLRPPLVEKILSHKDWFSHENRYRKKNGEVITGRAQFRSVQTPEGIAYLEGFVEDVTASRLMEEQLIKKTHNLGERVKELQCLYSLANLVAKPDISLDEVLQEVLELIPPGWQYPDITCARLTFRGRSFESANFKEAKWSQSSDILVHGTSQGAVEVFYRQEMPTLDEGPFLTEERSLLDAIAKALGATIERRQADETLRRELAVNAALTHLHKPLVAPFSSILEISLSVLEQAQKLTSSEHGYVSTIDPNTGDNVSHTLTEMMLGQCQVEGEDRRITFPRGPDGRYPQLWGHALNTGEAFYTNSPASHPASTGKVPAGHIPIERFLAVPVMLGQELVGEIALANPDRDYTDQDLELMKRLSEFYALVIQRRRFEEELQKARDGLERQVNQRTAELLQSNIHLIKMISEREKFAEGLHQSEQKLRDLTAQLLTAQEEERRRLSLELHDELGQSLIVLKLQVRTLGRGLGSEQAIAQSDFDQLSAAVDEIIDNVRRLSRDISPSILEDLGLMAALNNLFAGVKEHYQLASFTADLDDLDRLFSPEIRTNIYRIFQESLTNIAKHASPSHVAVKARRQNHLVDFVIEDDGKGFDLQEVIQFSSQKRGMGLAAMEGRVRLLGGTFRMDSRPGQGTRINFTVPVTAPLGVS